MFAKDRFEKIRELLLEYKYVDVNTLSSILSVSVATVRRDLDKLESEGFLTKAHGGAIINEEENNTYASKKQSDPDLDKKVQIGMIAAEMIQDNNIVFLGSGSTCLQISKHIKNKNGLTIVTNNIDIVSELSNSAGINVIATGGQLIFVGNSLAMSGEYAQNNLRKMFFNKAFISVDGITIENGYSVNNNEIALINSIILENSNETIIAADSSKFGKRAFSLIGSIDLVKKIVTNVDLESSFKEALYDNEIKLYTAYEQISQYED